MKGFGRLVKAVANNILTSRNQFSIAYTPIVEACVAEWLTPRTPDLEVRGSSLARPVVSLDKKLYSTFSLLNQARVVQTMDSALHRINHYPADTYYENQLHYPLESDLSGVERYVAFKQLGEVHIYAGTGAILLRGNPAMG